jgi:hypothetical protein
MYKAVTSFLLASIAVLLAVNVYYTRLSAMTYEPVTFAELTKYPEYRQRACIADISYCPRTWHVKGW